MNDRVPMSKRNEFQKTGKKNCSAERKLVRCGSRWVNEIRKDVRENIVTI